MHESISSFFEQTGLISFGKATSQGEGKLAVFHLKIDLALYPTRTEYIVGWLGFYGISTFVGHLTPNQFLCK